MGAKKLIALILLIPLLLFAESSLRKDVLILNPTTIPAAGIAGEVRHDTSTNNLKLYNGTAWSSIGSGGGGGKNYFVDGDFESGILLATVYDDSTVYVDGSGGSPTSLSIASNETTPLNDSVDLKITKAATDSSGEGVTLLSAAIDKAHRGRNLFVSFEWDGTDSAYTSGDIFLEAFDVGTGNKILNVVAVAGLNDDGSLPNQKSKIVAYIPTTTSTDSTVRVSLHLPSDSDTGTAFSVYIDDAKIGPDSVIPGAIITKWVEYTPAFVAMGTAVLDVAWWRRVGENMEIKARWTTGTVTAAVPTMSLPTGKVIATRGISIPSGSWRQGGVSTSDFKSGSILTADAGTTISFHDDNSDVTSSGNPFSSANATVILKSSTAMSMELSVRIEGWEASAALSTTEAALMTIVSSASTTAGQSITTASYQVIDFNNVDFDEYGIFPGTGSSWKATVPRAGKYEISTRASLASSTGWESGEQILLRVDRYNAAASLQESKYVSGMEVMTSDASAATVYGYAQGSPVMFDAAAGDYFQTKIYQDNDSTLAMHTAGGHNYFQIKSLPDFTHFSIYGETELLEVSSSGAAYSTFGAVNNYVDIALLTLTPGEWDLSAVTQWRSAGAVTTTLTYMGISTTSGNDGSGMANPSSLLYQTKGQTSGDYDLISLPNLTVTVTTPTIYYLKGRANTSITNLEVGYKMTARKIK